MHDARECSSTRHSAPRPSTKLRRRNEMTHPPRIISRKRLIKPSLETPRSGSIPIDPCWIAYNYVRSRCAYSLSLSPLRRRRPLKIRPERKTCNFDNQSRERRLIFTIQRAAAFIYIYMYRMGTEMRLLAMKRCCCFRENPFEQGSQFYRNDTRNLWVFRFEKLLKRVWRGKKIWIDNRVSFFCIYHL